MNYTRIDVHPVSGALGAEISGVRLAESLDDETFKELRDAWLTYQVLFFRDQELTPDQHVAFAGRFGEFQKPGFVPTLEDQPNIRKQEMDEYSKIGSDVTWHTDDTFLETPSMGSVLYALDVPEAGGDTVWINMYRAFETLSEPMQAFISPMTAIHDISATMGIGILRNYGAEAWQKLRSSTPPVEHPVVRTHPETGRKSLFVNPLLTSSIKGLSEPESRMLLDLLFQHMQQPENMCRFRWRKHSVAFWDNRSTAHKGVNDFYPAHRLMHRVAVADTERPR